MMRFIAGVLAALVVLAAAVLVCISFGFVPARADSPAPSKLERWAARTSLRATIQREMPQLPYPYPPNDANVVAGAKLYMQYCGVCHGSGSGDESLVAKGMYVHPPQFAKHGVDDDPEGMNYWKIEHGIRFTGMPAFAKSLSEEQIWQIAAFITRPLKDLPPAAAAEFNQPHGD